VTVGGSAYALVVKRVFSGAVLFYLLCALIGRGAERLGATRCGCAATCWCKQPLLSVFRWVFPFGHTPGQPHTNDVEPALSKIGG